MQHASVVLVRRANNSSVPMLKHRLLTAFIALPLLALAIWFFPPIPFAVVLTLLVGYSAWEWSSLVGLTQALHRAVYVAAVLLVVLGANWLPMFPVLVVGFIALLWAFAAIVWYQCDKKPLGLQHAVGRGVVGVLLLVPFWVAAMTLRLDASMGPGWVFYAMAIAWATDTGGYFAGKYWGQHKLIPRVSPNKTWEGLIGGFVLALITAFVASFFFPFSAHQRLFMMAIAVVSVFASVVGDLSVSVLKRITGLKDTGSIIPGHGGLLDRMDSLAAAFIVFAIGALLLGL